MLITPDPLHRSGLIFTPVFDYEQVLVVAKDHPLSNKKQIQPQDLNDQTLITYPVSPERLDIYSQFLQPTNSSPRQHKTIETTEIMLQMIAAGRGVGALPEWLVKENSAQFGVQPVRLGKQGIQKQIYLGIREQDADMDYLKGFIEMAKG